MPKGGAQQKKEAGEAGIGRDMVCGRDRGRTSMVYIRHGSQPVFSSLVFAKCLRGSGYLVEVKPDRTLLISMSGCPKAVICETPATIAGYNLDYDQYDRLLRSNLHAYSLIAALTNSAVVTVGCNLFG
jgi:hypothetical protein